MEFKITKFYLLKAQQDVEVSFRLYDCDWQKIGHSKEWRALCRLADSFQKEPPMRKRKEIKK